MVQQDLSSLPALFLAVVCGVLGFLWIQHRKDKSRNSSVNAPRYPPTPKDEHWLFGHVLNLIPTKLGFPPNVSHDILFFEWMSRLESKVVMFRIPFKGRLISVGDPAVARFVLQTKTKSASGTTTSLFGKHPNYSTLGPLVGRKSLVAIHGDEHTHQRRLYNPGFSQNFLKKTVATIAKKCDRFLSVCENEDIANGLPTDLDKRAIDLTSDVIAEAAFGEDWGDESDDVSRKCGIEILNLFQQLLPIVGANFHFPVNKLRLVRRYKTWRLSRDLDRCMQRLVQRRIDRLQQANSIQDQLQIKDILSLTLSSLEASSNGPSIPGADMELITSQLRTFYFAGYDTTGHTIAWAYWLLVQHPDKLERTRQELWNVLGKEWSENALKGNSSCHNHGLTYEQIQECEYLNSIILETLRLYPPAASSRYAVDDKSSIYENKLKLGGCAVSLNFYAIQRDPDTWGPTANDFCPERFLGEEGRTLARSNSFLPFSRGQRDCIGKYFALLEAKIAIACLVTRFDGIAVDPEKEVYRSQVISGPLNGCKVRLSRRVCCVESVNE